MSFLNMGRKAPLLAPADPVDPVVRRPWWRANAYRRHDIVRDGQAELGLEKRGEGYAEGRRGGEDLPARSPRRGHPVLATIVFLLAAITVGYVYLSYQAGSFAGGGALIDQKIAAVRGDVGRAGEASGQAVQNAGQRITNHSRRLSQGAGN
jgi:hypothetical protein